MLDINFIRNNKKIVDESARARGVDIDLQHLIEVDEKRRTLQKKVDDLRREMNELVSEFKKRKPTPEEQNAARNLKKQIEAPEKELEKVQQEFKKLMYSVPNLLHESVPIGPDESANEVIKKWGEIPSFDFEPKNHLELGESLDLIDVKTAAKTSGSRFYYLKNGAVLLEFALVQWLLEKYLAKGFTPVTTPELVKDKMLYATGFFPAEKNEVYHVNPDSDDLYLIGTSEITLAGLHMFEPVNKDDLPKRYIGFSTCYRREAGSYGKDTQGIFRVHQFDKMEMYSYVLPDKSWEEHEFLLSIEEEILQELGLPYQVVNIASGDLGAPAAKKYDCEVWIPSQNKYRELTSCSNTTDFQARRGGIRYKDEEGAHYLHTLNGTAMAFTRTLIAIMENYQTKDGRVKVPEVLKEYMLGKEEL